MGSRANYILIEQGKTKMYKYRAYNIPEILLAGFASARIYIQHLMPCEELWNEIWADGGVLIDSDRRQLLFWGYDDGILCEPHLRRFFLPALHYLWPGWTVEWALHGVADLADYLHIDRSTVLTREEFEEGFDPDNPISDDELLRCEYRTTVITIKRPDGLVLDYVLWCLPGTALSAGPHLLDVLLSRGKPVNLPYEREVDSEADGGAFFDLTTHEMWVWNPVIIDPRYLEALRQLWTGWQVNEHADGIVRQVVLSGRDATSIMIPEDEAVADLIRVLTMSGPHMPSLTNMIAAVTTNIPEGTDQVEIAPGFFSAPDETISVEERRQILQRLFRTSS